MPAARDAILVVLPTEWDRMQIPAWLETDTRYEVVFGALADADCPEDLDPLAYVDALLEQHPDVAGVTSSSDYPGATLAGLFAERRGLPGARPDLLLRTSHKYYARCDQQRVAPEAVPPFALVEPGRPLPDPFPLAFPCFVKPTKGAFSRFARRVADAGALTRFLATPEVVEYATHYVGIYNRLIGALTDLEHDGRFFLAEGLLVGRQVTVEGFLCGGEATILGVVDSRFHPGTQSFSRFSYPSELPEEVCTRLESTAARVAEGSGLDQTLFNVEMTFDIGTGRIGVIELNTRMCGQFADLYAKVDGTHGHEIAFDLAAGRRPRVRRREGPFAAAASIPLRTLEPVRVVGAPTPERIAEVRARHPDTLVVNECAVGQELSDFAAEDGSSIRYGVVNLGGDSPADVYARAVSLVEELGYRFEPLA